MTVSMMFVSVTVSVMTVLKTATSAMTTMAMTNRKFISEGIGFNLGSRTNCNYSMIFEAQYVTGKLFSNSTGSENSPTKWCY
jgi:predicted membrane chloride channel (bestrophin family)